MFPLIETPNDLDWVDYLVNGLCVVAFLGFLASVIWALV